MSRSIRLLIVLLLFSSHIKAEEFLSPITKTREVSVKNDKAKYFEIKPGQELSFKVVGPNTVKIYGRVINPAKSGNASFMVYQGNTLIGAMLVTPKPSNDFADGNKNLPLSSVTIQEFSVSEGEQSIKIKSSAKSPDAIVAIEVMKSQEASIDLVPLVPLAPLTPPKKEEKSDSIELVPLVPLTPPPEKKAESGPSKKISEKPKKEEGYREIVAQKADESTGKNQPEKKAPSITTIVEKEEKPSIGKRVLRLGLDAGLIVPSQSIGGPYPNANLNVFFFPLRNNPAFGLGFGAGYHNLKIDLKDGSGHKIYNMSASIIPLNLDLIYSIAVSRLILIDIFAGGGIDLVSADLDSKLGAPSRSASSIVPSFQSGLCLTFRLKKGNSLHIKTGFEGGRASLDFVKDLDVGGIFLNAGYNYSF